MDFTKLNINFPTACPICGGSLIINDKMTKITCSNPCCGGYASGNISKWMQLIKADGFGDAVITDLLSIGIKSVSDLYAAADGKIFELKKLDGYGDKKINKLVSELKKRPSMTLAKFIAALNIEGIAEKKAAKIIGNASSLEEIDSIKFNTEIGEKTMEAFCNGWKDVREEAYKLIQYVNIDGERPTTCKEGKLAGEKICFTGKSEYPRSKMKAIAEEAGAIVLDSVTKDCTILIVGGGDSNSSKAVKAKKNGIRVESDSWLFENLKI